MKSKLMTIACFPLWIAALLLFGGGCDTYIVRDDPYYQDCGGSYPDRTPPPIPRGVHSVTGDNRVYLYWEPVYSYDLSGYAVYRGYSETGYYDYIGSSYCAGFTDYTAQNGQTYYYAISSIDAYGNESGLSVDLIYDTPRPEGHSWFLWASETYYYDGGYDFSESAIVPWDHPACDVFFGHDAYGYYLCAANSYTDILDWGYATSLSEIDAAPESGWSSTADLAATVGHIYVIWTADNHFATIHITDISGERLRFDWSYQTAVGNPELRPSPETAQRRENRKVTRGPLAASKGE